MVRFDLKYLYAGLFALLLGSMVATGLELVFMEHYETIWQLIPLLALGMGALALVAVAVWPVRNVVRGFRLLMLAFIVAGLLGFYLHYRGNAEFELELHPDLGGWDLFRSTLSGATPALAPGTMIQLGVLGLLYTYGNPRMRTREAKTA